MARWFIVEDDPHDQSIFEIALEPVDGVEVEMFCSGHELLDRLEAGDLPDLVVLDLGLPDLAGAEIIAELREIDATATLPIVMLSSTTDPARIDHAYRNGANVFFAKPTSVGELTELFIQTRDHWDLALLAPFERVGRS